MLAIRWMPDYDSCHCTRYCASLLFEEELTDDCCQDVHGRYRTESHLEAAGRFNERFLLSLASCKACVLMDDEMNILPISSHIRSITPVAVKEVYFNICKFQSVETI